MILQKDFYNRDTTAVEKELLGKYLVRKIGNRILAYSIIETEAYVGPNDKACHASRGFTKRTAVMFGPPGIAYIYLIYGMYYCLNIVTRESGYPAAVLIRALDHPEMTGPGRLTKFLNITGSHNGADMTKRYTLWIENRGVIVKKNAITATPRIGVGYAGEWSKKPFRYIIKNSD